MAKIDLILESLLFMLLALQSQYRTFLEDQPRQMKEMKGSDEWSTGQGVNVYDLEIRDLTKIEEQSVELEQRLRRTRIEILTSGSRSSRQQWKRDVKKLKNDLKKLQKEVRAAIKMRSTSQFFRRNFNRFMMKHKNLRDQTGEIYRRPFSSLPNIPSLLDEDLDYDPLYKWKSVNRTIDFKDPLKGRLKNLEAKLDNLSIKLKDIIIKNRCLRDKVLRATNYSSEETDKAIEDDIMAEQRPSHSNNPSVSPLQNTGTTVTRHSTTSGTTVNFRHDIQPQRYLFESDNAEDIEDDILAEQRPSHSNNPGVSPSQNTGTTVTRHSTTSGTTVNFRHDIQPELYPDESDYELDIDRCVLAEQRPSHSNNPGLSQSQSATGTRHSTTSSQAQKSRTAKCTIL